MSNTTYYEVVERRRYRVTLLTAADGVSPRDLIDRPQPHVATVELVASERTVASLDDPDAVRARLEKKGSA